MKEVVLILLGLSTAVPIASSQEPPAEVQNLTLDIGTISAVLSTWMLFEDNKNISKSNKVSSGYASLVPLGQLILGSSGGATYGTLVSLLLMLNGKNDVLRPVPTLREDLKDALSKARLRLERNKNGVTIKQSAMIYADAAQVNKIFRNYSASAFGTEVKDADLSGTAESAIAAVNSWIVSETADQIKQVLPPQSIEYAEMILANALYFKGAWRYKMQASSIRPFISTKRKVRNIPYMYVKDLIHYTKSKELDATLVKLPFGTIERNIKEDVSIIVVLPNKYDGILDLSTLGDTLVPKLKRAIKDMELIGTNVYIPKFKADNKYDFMKPFAPIAAFSFGFGVVDQLFKKNIRVELSEGLQSTSIEVNEKGVVAATCNGLTIRQSLVFDLGIEIPPFSEYDIPKNIFRTSQKKSSRSKGPVPLINPVSYKELFVADHPFLYLIVDGDYVLFSGVVSSP